MPSLAAADPALLVPLGTPAHARLHPPGLGCVLETSCLPDFGDRGTFSIPLGAVLCQSAFVGEFVRGKTFAPATVQMGIIGKNRKEGYGLWS